jgi:hypothetical protein
VAKAGPMPKAPTVAGAMPCFVCWGTVTSLKYSDGLTCSPGCAMDLRRQQALQQQRDQDSMKQDAVKAAPNQKSALKPASHKKRGKVDTTPGWLTAVLTVEVTAQDLREGLQRSTVRSPVALAARRSAEALLVAHGIPLGDLLSSRHDIAVWTGDSLLPLCYPLPAPARKLCREFDSGRRVRPLTFDIPQFQIPECGPANKNGPSSA